MEPGLRLLLLPWSSVWGENWSLSAGFVATAGVISWIWPLAGIAVKAVRTSGLRSSCARMCVCIHTDKGTKMTRTRKWHLNYGGMLYKISGTFLGTHYCCKAHSVR